MNISWSKIKLNSIHKGECVQFFRRIYVLIILVFLCVNASYTQNYSINIADQFRQKGLMAYDACRYNDALECFLTAKGYLENVDDINNEEYVIILKDIAGTCSRQNRISDACKYMRLCVQSSENVFGTDSVDFWYYALLELDLLSSFDLKKDVDEVLRKLDSLSVDKSSYIRFAFEAKYVKMMYEKGEYSNAISNGSRSAHKYVIDADTIQVSLESLETMYNVIALCYYYLHDIQEAIAWCASLYQIKIEKLALPVEDCLTELHNLSHFYFMAGESELGMQLALSLLEYSSNKKDLDYASEAHNVASIYAKNHDYKNAIKWSKQAVSIRESILGTHGSGSEPYCTSLENLCVYYACSKQRKKSLSLLEKVVEWHEENGCTARSLNIMACVYQFNKNEKKANECLLKSIVYYRNDLTRILQNTMQRQKQFFMDRYCLEIDASAVSLACNANNINDYASFLYDMCLLTKSVTFLDDYEETFAYDWLKVKQNLAPNDVAIEFHQRLPENDSTLGLVVSILRETWDAPRCYLWNWDDSDLNPYERLWQTIIEKGEIRLGDNIYYSPDGILLQIPFEHVYTSDGVSIGEKYNIYRVSSTRELCSKNINKPISACLIGGLNYQEKKEVNVENSKDRDLRASFSYLPYSKKEVDTICSLMKEYNMSILNLCEDSGDENTFRKLSGESPSILHIATHGFSLNDLTILDEDSASTEIDYAMSHTGLLLSGAMAKLISDSIILNVNDGILTAAEIAELDLTRTDLVVLSACKTGLGHISSDGIAGLQRGFKMAGVNSIMMSLWQVDDAATYLLMTEFYKNYLGGKTKTESLREAQRYLRNYEQDGEKIFADPKYWAAFVLLDALD